MVDKLNRKELRRFGLLVGSVFAVIAAWPLVLHGERLRLWAAVPAAVLVVLGLAAPTMLKPIHAAWLTIGHALGWVNTRIILGLVFYLVITPMGLVMRLLGKDPMRRGFIGELESYRLPKSPRPAAHLNRQF